MASSTLVGRRIIWMCVAEVLHCGSSWSQVWPLTNAPSMSSRGVNQASFRPLSWAAVGSCCARAGIAAWAAVATLAMTYEVACVVALPA